MRSSSRRNGPSSKAGFKALSYSNLESVSWRVLIARVSSVLPGTLRAKSVGTNEGKGASTVCSSLVVSKEKAHAMPFQA